MRTRRSASSSSDPVSSTRHQKKKVAKTDGHTSVLLQEVIDVLAPQAGDIVLDATLGGAGHARALCEHLGNEGIFIGLDAEGAAVERSRTALSASPSAQHLVQANFREIDRVLEALGIAHITKALFDLGWSSYQLGNGRGFSFLADEPLLMTYSDTITPETLTAEKIVNTWEEGNLTAVISGWGEERHAARIARGIVEARAKAPIKTSRELGEIIAHSVPSLARHGKVHPATRTFQALRIAVNDELGSLREGITSAWKHLLPKGRLAVITFHSIEDREVKKLFRSWEEAGECERVNKKVIKPSYEEIKTNRRARSATLRCIQKI